MELKEYIKIFKKKKNWFLASAAVVFLIGLVLQLWMSGKYKAEIDLNITRTGYQSDTTEYRYDEFYRLQADERFADTVVRWLGSKNIQAEILKQSGISFSRLKAERLSSQMIRVSFVIKNQRESDKMAQTIAKILNEQTNELNAEQKNPDWFKILASSPIVNQFGISWLELFLILICLGAFVGFWAVLVAHYLE